MALVGTPAAFASAVNAPAFFRTNSCTLCGPRPVSARTSFFYNVAVR